MKTVLVAPDSFKGSLSAVDFCRIVERAGQGVADGLNFISRPMSDGGEGFVESITYAGLAESHEVIVQDPLGRPVAAKFGWQPDSKPPLSRWHRRPGCEIGRTRVEPDGGLHLRHRPGLGGGDSTGRGKIILGLAAVPPMTAGRCLAGVGV